MTTVSLKNISKYYGDIRAVEGVSLDVREKEFLTVLGPSGCGKTTLLRLVAGLETPSSGDILLNGESVLNVPVNERDLAMIFQTYALYNHMTVYDNIAFPLKMRRLSAQEIDGKVKATADLLGIKDQLSRKPVKLSGGEQQRVAIGRAIVREPKVFLMDEPLTFLDPKLRTNMRVEIKMLQRRLGVTTIYVTHDQAEAMTMSDRIALLNKGMLQQVGTPGEVYNKPANTFAAGFLGSPSMNFFDCSYLEEDGKAFLDEGAFKLDVTEFKGVIDEKRSGGELILGVRPENILLSRKKSASAFESEVYLTEPLGSEVIVILRLGTSIVNVKAGAGTDVKTEEKVWVSFDKSRIRVFAKSGEALL